MSRIFRTSTLWPAVVGILFAGCACAQPVGPQPGYYGIGPGHDFPASESVLEGYRSTQDVHQQRLHAWNVFSGLIEPTPDGKYARWETWYSESETFQDAPLPQGLGPRKIQREFTLPHQFSGARGAVPQAAGSGLLSFVLFNYETYQHIRTNALYRRAVLDGFARSGSADRLFPDNWAIPEFPVQAMSLKIVWWPVAGDKVTGMPIWDGDPNPASKSAKPYKSWPRAVAITTSGTPAPNATADVNLFGKRHAACHLVGLSAFYSIALDPGLASQLNSDKQLSETGKQVLHREFRVGDYVVLAGMHMTTKEIKNWVWATFWWHDKPNVGPFAADRPATIGAPWANYLMSASYDQNTPKSADGSPHSAFNPWLETHFPNGVNSNCMTCHHRASNNGTDFLPITVGESNPNDAAFSKGSVRTDFLWSIPDNAAPIPQ